MSGNPWDMYDERQKDIREEYANRARIDALEDYLKHFVYTVDNKPVTYRKLIQMIDTGKFPCALLRNQEDFDQLVTILSREGNHTLVIHKTVHMKVKPAYLEDYLKRKGSWLSEYVRVVLPKKEAELIFLRALNFFTEDVGNPWIPDPTSGVVLDLVQSSRSMFQAKLDEYPDKYKIKDIRSIKVYEVTFAEEGVVLLVDTLARYERA
jgi:hypothetical protein